MSSKPSTIPSSRRIANLSKTTSRSLFSVFPSSTGHSSEMLPHSKKVLLELLMNTKTPETRFSVKTTMLNPIGSMPLMIWPVPLVNSWWNVKKLAGNGLVSKLDQVPQLSSHQNPDKSPSLLPNKLKKQQSLLPKLPLKRLNLKRRSLLKKRTSETSGQLLTTPTKLSPSKVKMSLTNIKLESSTAKTLSSE